MTSEFTANLPENFRTRMQAMLGSEWDSFLNSYEKDNTHGLRVNTLKLSIEDLLQNTYFSQNTETLNRIPWAEDGLEYPSAFTPGKYPLHEAGAYYIQEPSAMIPASYLNSMPGECILDLCAAPGGKSTQIASGMQQKGILLVNEIHPARAKILSENIERMGIANAVVLNETPQKLAMAFPLCFDKIMVDAPCSGEGMFRKNEEAIHQWSSENVEICAKRQDEILDCAARMCKAGGTIVYSTCTFAPLENEGTILRFLKKHPDFHVENVDKIEGMSAGNVDFLNCPAKENEAYEAEDFTYDENLKAQISKTIRLFPHKAIGEGHFIAVLKKDGELSAAAFHGSSEGYSLIDGKIKASSDTKKKAQKGKAGKKTAPNSTDFLSVVQEFIDTEMKEIPDGRIIQFGQQIYLQTEAFPLLSGLRVLRPGLHLGSVEKGRFEPSHALALWADEQKVLHYVNLSSANPEEYRIACQFIEGQTFPYEGEKGWYVICLDHISLGYGKLAGNIMKNHYPKGLRKSCGQV